MGKSTLVQKVCANSWVARYLSLDDRVVLDSALDNPDGLLRDLTGNIALDEVQKAPDLLRAVKLVVDRDRRPGRFLLTGSANVATLSAVSETLAGRAAVLTIHPFSIQESRGLGGAGTLIDELFSLRDAAAVIDAVPEGGSLTDSEIKRFILSGGYPDPCLMESASVRDRWFASYRQTYVERDIRDVAGIGHVSDFSRLLAILAHRTGTMLNSSELSRQVGLPVTTLRRYFAVMTQTYQVFTLAPFNTNFSKRLVKTPKFFFSDTGFACHLAGLDDWNHLERQSRVGQMVETWIAAELRVALAHTGKSTALSYMRTVSGKEVDFVLERGDRVIGIEVKWGTSIGRNDLAGLVQLKQGIGERFAFGIVLYRGDEVVTMADGIVAIPFHRFF